MQKSLLKNSYTFPLEARYYLSSHDLGASLDLEVYAVGWQTSCSLMGSRRHVQSADRILQPKIITVLVRRTDWPREKWFAFYKIKVQQTFTPDKLPPNLFPSSRLKLWVWCDVSEKWRDCVLGAGFKSNINISIGCSKLVRENYAQSLRAPVHFTRSLSLSFW